MGLFSSPKSSVPPPPPLPPAANPPTMASGAVQATGSAARKRITDAAGQGFANTNPTGPGGTPNVQTAAPSLAGGLKTNLGG